MKLRILITCLSVALPVVAAASAGVDFHLDRDIATSSHEFLSQPIHTENPMDRAVVSWNVDTPGTSYIDVYLRAQGTDHHWTKWYRMGTWGIGINSHSYTGQKDSFGEVDADTLKLATAANDWQYKIVLHDGKSKEAAALHAAAVTFKNSKTYQKNMTETIRPAKPLTVPTISQYEFGRLIDNPELGKRICSPTSVTMLLQFNGLTQLTPIVTAVEVNDATGSEHYGNWPFNTAVIYAMLKRGVSYVRWYESFDNLLDHVRAGEPVIVSISFKAGELKGAFTPTSGHLVVVRGADKKYIYVNDPAAPDARQVAHRYLKSEFIKAWKGIAYVTEK